LAYAILKHRLMDISVVIRKTVVYSIVTAVLTVTYVMISAIVAKGLQGWVVSPTGFSSASAACAIALLFHPLRLKIQRYVDRHFFREALDQSLLREATDGFIHEIKKPLANITLPTELSVMDIEDWRSGKLSADKALTKIAQRLQYILNQTSDTGNRIDAIRAVTSTGENQSGLVDLMDVIQRSASLEKGLLEKNRVSLTLELAPGLPGVRGYAKQLEIVMRNLMKNAVEAIALQGALAERRILIMTRKAQQTVVLLVKDSGPGMKAEDLAHLFEPYFSTKGSHGMGMGLFLCRQIIHAHGGRIDARNGDDGGAELRVILPQSSPLNVELDAGANA
jgi:signal transduction histidine kinase